MNRETLSAFPVNAARDIKRGQNVPKGDLYRPSGLNPIDGRLKAFFPGQRRYNPSGQGIISTGEAVLGNTLRLGGPGGNK